MSPENFLGFLHDTLIPDLRESGREFTAGDLERCANLAESALDALADLLADVENAVDYGMPFEDENNPFHVTVMAARRALRDDV